MSYKLVAVQGMTLYQDDPSVVCTVFFIFPPTISKNFAENKLFHADGDMFMVNAITVPSAGATIPDPATYAVPLNASTTKVEAENKNPLRLGDLSDTINAIPKIPGTPPVDYPVSFKMEITDAGQMKVFAND